jgi:hypothetical protein
MSLLKSLQILVTGADIYWVPAAHPRVCRLVNELVLEEESDDDGNSGNARHFKLYLAAMQEAVADRFSIGGFVNGLSRDRF